MLLGLIAAFGAGGTLLLCMGTDTTNPLLWILSFIGFFLLGIVLAFAFLYIMAKRVDKSVPQEQDSPFYRKLADIYIRGIVRLCRIRVKTEGMEQLPGEGRYLLVCNHLCIADPVVLLYCFAKSQLAFISKKENDDMLIVGEVMHKLQCQLIDRENDRAALKTIIKCIQILKEDKASVAVFPEGYCSDDGLLRHFRPGVFKIAQKANVPIVVCTLRDTIPVIPNIKKLKGSKVELHLVGVVQPEEFAGKTTVDIADRVYAMMADDLGEDMVYHGE